MTKTLWFMTTGDPAEAVHKNYGTWAKLIRDCIGDAWEGPVKVFDARDEAPFPEANAVDVLVITGSSENVPKREPWMLRSEAWLRDVVKSTPTFGVCFGHQLLAQALGGEVAKNPKGREVGTAYARRGEFDDPILDGVPERFAINQSHGDSVSKLPPGTTILASNDHDPHQLLRFSETCYGAQFHPELTPPVMTELLEARRPLLEPEGFDVNELKAKTEPAPHSIDTIRNFFKHIVK